MRKWLSQTSTIGGILGLILTAIQLIQSGATPLSVASGIVSSLLLLVNDGAFLKGLFPVLFVGMISASTVGCGGTLGQFADQHQSEINDLKSCAIECGTDIAVDALACPITGGSIKDLVDAEVAKGMAETAGACVLSCLGKQAVNVLSEVCKK